MKLTRPSRQRLAAVSIAAGVSLLVAAAWMVSAIAGVALAGVALFVVGMLAIEVRR